MTTEIRHCNDRQPETPFVHAWPCCPCLHVQGLISPRKWICAIDRRFVEYRGECLYRFTKEHFMPHSLTEEYVNKNGEVTRAKEAV